MKNNIVTIEIDGVQTVFEGKSALAEHIRQLRATITKRNEEIKALNEEIETLKVESERLTSDPNGFLENLQRQSYAKGFNECRSYVRKQFEPLSDWLNKKDEDMWL